MPARRQRSLVNSLMRAGEASPSPTSDLDMGRRPRPPSTGCGENRQTARRDLVLRHIGDNGSLAFYDPRSRLLQSAAGSNDDRLNSPADRNVDAVITTCDVGWRRRSCRTPSVNRSRELAQRNGGGVAVVVRAMDGLAPLRLIRRRSCPRRSCCMSHRMAARGPPPACSD
jgi:hypothetical protein